MPKVFKASYIYLLSGTLLGAPLEIVKVQASPLHSLIDQADIQFCIDPCVFKFFFYFSHQGLQLSHCLQVYFHYLFILYYC